MGWPPMKTIICEILYDVNIDVSFQTMYICTTTYTKPASSTIRFLPKPFWTNLKLVLPVPISRNTFLSRKISPTIDQSLIGLSYINSLSGKLKSHPALYLSNNSSSYFNRSTYTKHQSTKSTLLAVQFFPFSMFAPTPVQLPLTWLTVFISLHLHAVIHSHVVHLRQCLWISLHVEKALKLSYSIFNVQSKSATRLSDIATLHRPPVRSRFKLTDKSFIHHASGFCNIRTKQHASLHQINLLSLWYWSSS